MLGAFDLYMTGFDMASMSSQALMTRLYVTRLGLQRLHSVAK